VCGWRRTGDRGWPCHFRPFVKGVGGHLQCFLVVCSFLIAAAAYHSVTQQHSPLVDVAKGKDNLEGIDLSKRLVGGSSGRNGCLAEQGLQGPVAPSVCRLWTTTLESDEGGGVPLKKKIKKKEVRENERALGSCLHKLL